jgi:pilus assembly protein CpaC
MAIKRALLILLIVMTASSFVYAADESINLLVGRSTVIDTGSPIQRVSLTSSDVADALVTSSAQLLVHGKIPGRISMFVWDRGGAIHRYDVTVQRDLSRLTTQVNDLFPAEHIKVESNGRSIVVAGMVSSKFVAEKAVEVAAGYVDKKEDVVNLLQVQEGAVRTKQVLLRVRFAEVSRSALTELGVSLFTSPTGVQNTLARLTTQQYAAPGFTDLNVTKDSAKFGADPTSSTGKFTFGDFLNLFLFSNKFDIGAMVKALQTKGLFQNLAEPNLVAESGKEASFLAGGEFPIPIAQGSGANIGISVQFKEFGVRLAFTPTVIGDRVHLKVKPEVSSLDFNNAVVLGGFRIPALTTRRTETELELQNGQTFAIAGLLNNSMTTSMSKIPGIGDIPILGLLFKSKAAQKDQTELVVMITPQILPDNSSGVTTELPRLVEPYLPPTLPKVTLPTPPPAFSSPRPGGDGAASAATPVSPAAVARTPSAQAAAAAATVSALTPKGPTVVKPSARAANQAPASNGAPSARPADVKVLEKARREEERATREQVKRDAATSEAAAQQAEIQRRKDEQETKRQEQLAREQAKRDAEAAAKATKAAAHQAEVDKRQQKVIDEAAARLKAAQTSYQSEIAKKDKSASDQ